MIVQGFNVEFEFSVAHSTGDCAGATALTYTVEGGAARVTVECDRAGCKPIILTLRLREQAGAR